MSAWYVVTNGKPSGPYSIQELKKLAIKSDSFLKSEEMDDYKEAHEIPQIRELFGFKHATALPQYFATLDQRLIAVAIDYLLIFAVYCILALIVMAFTGQQAIRLAISVSGLIVIPAFKFIYSIIMESSSRQGTFGKSFLGLKITDEQGLPITFSRSLIRNLSKLLSTATLGIGYLSGFFDKRQQCLHDKLAGTLVVKDRLI